jgi:hypothetical protein
VRLRFPRSSRRHRPRAFQGRHPLTGSGVDHRLGIPASWLLRGRLGCRFRRQRRGAVHRRRHGCPPWHRCSPRAETVVSQIPTRRRTPPVGPLGAGWRV